MSGDNLNITPQAENTLKSKPEPIIFCWHGEVLDPAKTPIEKYDGKIFCAKHIKEYQRKQNFRRAKESPKYGAAAV